GNPQTPELSDILCPIDGGGMTRRVGKFGPFLGCVNYPNCKGILKLDPKKGTVVPPKVPPLQTDLPCPKCGAPLAMRRAKRGRCLASSPCPTCRGRRCGTAMGPDRKHAREKQLSAPEQANPQPPVKNTEGRVVGEDYVPRIMETAGATSGPARVEENGSANDT